MKKKLSLTQKIFIGIGLGIVAGLGIQATPGGFIRDELLLHGIIRFLGTGFIRSIQMLVVPLVFISLINGSASMGDIKKLGRIGGKTVGFFLGTTMFALILALGVGLVINPGVGLDLSNVVTAEPVIGEATGIVDTFLNMIPTNPMSALAHGQMLPIIIFAILIGVSMSMLGEKVEPLRTLVKNLDEVMMKLVDLSMKLAPIGVFGLITTTFATTGFDAIIPLIKYMGAIFLALALHAFVVYGGLLKVMTGLKLKPFFKQFGSMAAVPFSTASSNATLPVTINKMEEMGIDSNIAAFTLPLGATVNMDGTAIKQGIACIFIAQIYGIELGMSALLTIVLTATLASIGTAGVPGVGLITLTMVLTSVGLPVEGVGIIMGIDRLLDMARTTVNVMGDCVVTTIVAKSEGGLDLDKYYRSDKPAKAVNAKSKALG
ncbi:MAG: dicarboxylate/amino acid:cation symporter [Turicibacter sp.]|nr:dicarboxylate/amino acid:cation symporter [Turicibacter sp.]